MARRGVVMAAALLVAQAAGAQQAPLFPPITGLWLLPGTHQGAALPYGPSSPDADWMVGQWDIPANLPAFSGNSTSNQFASVTLGAQNSFALAQDATTLPCDRLYGSGRTMVNEYDLLVSSMPIPLLSALADPAARVRPRLPLDTISHVMVSGTVHVDRMREADHACKATQGVVGIGVVLTNLTSRQTLYYQVSFTVYRDPGTGFVATAAPANWFFRGNNVQNGDARQFGYGDRAWASYGMAPLHEGQSESFNIDVLPVLKQLFVEEAADGIDQNLDDWAVTGGYFGESAFGHVQVGSSWTHVDMSEN